MVQRKVPNKLGFQANHVKSEDLLANLKPSSLQHQDIKNKGTDLKKKMKKSGSFERWRAPTARRQAQQPGKPPPPDLPANSATPEKLYPIKGMIDITTPNYMKSTTSSDARKEQVQVSFRSPQTSSDSKISTRRNIMNLKTSSASGNKAARTLARTSSLKSVRTLTKTHSFKLTRASAKKCSPVILCENLDVQRATCSSTLKDHKFPDYVTLNAGGSESEGTSVTKVCPYTYCSLNGHRHDPLPPLKSFLSARRRALKAQRSLKLGCLSPRQAKPIVRDIAKQIGGEQVNFDEKPPFKDSLNISTNRSLIEDVQIEIGLFIEIDSKEREDAHQNNQVTTEFSVTDKKQCICFGDKTSTENETLDLETDVHENLDQSKKVTFVYMDTDENFHEQNQNTLVTEKVDFLNLAEGKTEQQFINYLYELEVEGAPSIQSEEADSESSDMDWVAGHCSASCPDGGMANQIQINDMIDLEKANSFLDNVFPDEIVQELIDDETEFEAWVDKYDSEFSIFYQNFATNELIKCENQRHNSPAPEELAEIEEDYANDKSDNTMAAFNSATIEKEGSNASITSKDKIKIQYKDNQQFGNPQMSENTNGKNMNSIGTQTESEFEDSEDLDEFLKRSIGTQTDYEDEHSNYSEDEAQGKDPELETWTCFERDLLKTVSKEIMVRGGYDEIPLEAITKEDLHETLVTEILSDQGKKSPAVSQSICSGNDLDSSEEDGNQASETAMSYKLNIHESRVNLTKYAASTRMKDEPVISESYDKLDKTFKIVKGTKRANEENKEPTEFSPKEPNFLEAEPDPEAERVDLRHLAVDENKNAAEWMLDYALQQAVTKLAPARKRKVALLVEAFETVLPTSKYEDHLRYTSTALSHVRPIQACS